MLSGLELSVASGLSHFKHDWQQGDRDHDDGYIDQVVAKRWVALAEKITSGRHADPPDQPAYEVVDDERAVAHLAYAGENWGEGSYDRNKPRENNRPGTMAIEKLLRTLDVVRVEQPRFWSVE